MAYKCIGGGVLIFVQAEHVVIHRILRSDGEGICDAVILSLESIRRSGCTCAVMMAMKYKCGCPVPGKNARAACCCLTFVFIMPLLFSGTISVPPIFHSSTLHPSPLPPVLPRQGELGCNHFVLALWRRVQLVPSWGTPSRAFSRSVLGCETAHDTRSFLLPCPSSCGWGCSAFSLSYFSPCADVGPGLSGGKHDCNLLHADA